MASEWPDDVVTTTLTWGGETTLSGAPLGSRLKISLVAPGVDRLVWTGTQRAVIPLVEYFDLEPGETGAAIVPVTDQYGWVDSSGASYTGWAYKAELDYGQEYGGPKIIRIFSPVTGQTTINLDTLPSNTPGTPVSAVIPAVTSVNGQTGDVTVSGGGGGGGTPAVEYTRTNSSVWILNHNLGHKPIVALYSADGEQIEAGVDSSTTSTTITFPAPYSGSAVLY